MGTAAVNAELWGARARNWAEVQEPTARPIYVHSLETVGVGIGTRVLDVGCGSGLALAIAAALGARVSGLDAAPELLAIAGQRVPAADIRSGEIETLPFDDYAFDVVTGFNSFQFAAQPVQALSEARRVTRPGGVVVIATWAPPALTQAARLLASLKPLLPPAPPDAPGPFALSDEQALRGFAEQAGLAPESMHDVSCPFEYPDLATAVRGLNSSGVAARAMGHSGEPAVISAHEAALREFERPDGTIHVPNTFRYLVAQA